MAKFNFTINEDELHVLVSSLEARLASDQKMLAYLEANKLPRVEAERLVVRSAAILKRFKDRLEDFWDNSTP